MLLLPLPALSAMLSAAAAFRAHRGRPLELDVLYYVELARHFGLHTFYGGMREPIWPMLLVLPVRLFDADPAVLQALGLIVFPLFVVAFQLLASRHVGQMVAWGAALILAASPWLARESVRVLREVPAATAVLLFLYVASRPGDRPWRRWALLGMLAGVAALIRWDTTLITLPSLVLLACTQDRRRVALVAVGVFGVMVAPLLIGNADKHGDPLYHSNIHAAFYRNYEFAGRPGYPTFSQVQQDPYTPGTTWLHYLFVDREPTQTLRKIPGGGRDIASDATSEGLYGQSAAGRDVVGHRWYWLLLGAAVYGGAVLLRARAWLLPMVTVIAVWEYAPIANQFDFRIAVLVYPLLLLLAAVGVADVAPRLRDVLDTRNAESAPPLGPGTAG